MSLQPISNLSKLYWLIPMFNYNLPSEDADELIAADIIPPAPVGAEDVEERRRNWDSSCDMVRNQSLSCWRSNCFSSCNLNLSAMHRFESSIALPRSLSNLLISDLILAISVSDLDLGVIERNSRSSCSFSWIRSNRSLSDSNVPGEILSSRAPRPYDKANYK